MSSLRLGHFLDLEVNEQVLEHEIRGLARSRYQRVVREKGVVELRSKSRLSNLGALVL